MFKSLEKFPEWRIVGFLGVITLSWHVISLFGSFLGSFADIFLIIILSWLFAFILEPFVNLLVNKGVPRVYSALIVYLLTAMIIAASLFIILPQTINQLSDLAVTLPKSLPNDSIFTPRLEAFLSEAISNSVSIASQLASAATGFLLIFIISFYFLISRKEISSFILKIIPDQYENGYAFLEKTLNESFATFIRVQFFIGLIIGAITFITLMLLKIDYALSSSIAAAILAMIPVIGTVLAVFPPLMSALLVSPNQALVAGIIIILGSQVVYNVIGPKMLGKAFKIHPVVVILSFVIGYKMIGVWGAIFSIPIVGSIAVITKDLLLFWKKEGKE